MACTKYNVTDNPSSKKGFLNMILTQTYKRRFTLTLAYFVSAF